MNNIIIIITLCILLIPGIVMIMLPIVFLYTICTDLYEANVISSTFTGRNRDCEVTFEYLNYIGSTVLPCIQSNETINMCYNKYYPKNYIVSPDKLYITNNVINYMIIAFGIFWTIILICIILWRCTKKVSTENEQPIPAIPAIRSIQVIPNENETVTIKISDSFTSVTRS